MNEKELLELLSVAEADRTTDQKHKLVDYMAAAERKPEPPATDNKNLMTIEDAFKHPRFKELVDAANEAKKRADALEKANQDAERKQLEEANEFKKLYEKAQAEIATLKPKAEGLESMEQTLSGLLEAEIKTLPEQFQDIVPEGTTKQKLEWLGKNKSKFMKPEAFEIGAGATGAKKDNTKKIELTAEQKQMARDYGIKEEDYIRQLDESIATAT